MHVGGDDAAIVGVVSDGGGGTAGVQPLHERGGGVGIQGTVEFVEQEYRAGTEQCPRYRYALRLPFTQSASGFVAGGVESLRQIEYEVGPGRVSRGTQRFIRGVWGGEA